MNQEIEIANGEYVSIEHNDTKKVDNREIILASEKATLVLSYPLSKKAEFEITSKGGFTRKQIADAICDKYKQVYKEEDESTKVQVVDPENRVGLMNRNQTDGKYGIWGHDIGDLVLHSVEIQKKGTEYLILPGIDS